MNIGKVDSWPVYVIVISMDLCFVDLSHNLVKWLGIMYKWIGCGCFDCIYMPRYFILLIIWFEYELQMIVGFVPLDCEIYVSFYNDIDYNYNLVLVIVKLGIDVDRIAFSCRLYLN